jgi:hypothetical protein
MSSPQTSEKKVFFGQEKKPFQLQHQMFRSNEPHSYYIDRTNRQDKEISFFYYFRTLDRVTLVWLLVSRAGPNTLTSIPFNDFLVSDLGFPTGKSSNSRDGRIQSPVGTQVMS